MVSTETKPRHYCKQTNKQFLIAAAYVSCVVCALGTECGLVTRPVLVKEQLGNTASGTSVLVVLGSWGAATAAPVQSRSDRQITWCWLCSQKRV